MCSPKDAVCLTWSQVTSHKQTDSFSHFLVYFYGFLARAVQFHTHLTALLHVLWRSRILSRILKQGNQMQLPPHHINYPWTKQNSLPWASDCALGATRSTPKVREEGKRPARAWDEAMSKERCHLIRSVLSNYSDTIWSARTKYLHLKGIRWN